jgi:hypothetical protein
LEQVCDILGLTIRGATPHLADEDRIRAAEDGQILDWSGRTTYWEELIQVTPGGAIHFVGALQVEFHDLHILENTFQGHRRVFMLRDSIAECEHWTTLGICPNQERLRLLLASDNATLADRDFAFEHIIDLGHSLNVGKSDASTTNCQHFHSKFLTVFGDEAVLADGLRAGFVRAMFPTDAPKSIDFITRLQAVTDRCFSRRVAWVESHGHLLEIGEEHALHSRDMADWCRQSPRHFIGWSERDFGNGKIVVGIRAI